jgi:hypothetical protein
MDISQGDSCDEAVDQTKDILRMLAYDSGMYFGISKGETVELTN